jgi:hypothetical protein
VDSGYWIIQTCQEADEVVNSLRNRAHGNLDRASALENNFNAAGRNA